MLRGVQGRSHPQECSCLDGTSSCSFCKGAAPLTPEGSGLQAETGGCFVLALTAGVSAPLARPTRPFVQRTTWRRAAVTTATALATRPHLLSPTSPTLDIPEAATLALHCPLAVWPYLGPHSGRHLPYRVETRRNVDQSGRSSRAVQGVTDKVPPSHSPGGSGAGWLLPSCKHSTRLWVPLPQPPPRLATAHTALLSGTLDSVC